MGTETVGQQQGIVNRLIAALRKRSRIELIGWGLWITLTVVISILIVINPVRSIFDIYREAAVNWWAGNDLYAIPGLYRFVYLPSTTLVLTPFILFPAPLDDILWRVASVALFTFGIWRLTALIPKADRPKVLAIILLLLIPCSGVNIQRSQAEIMMAAGMLLAGADAAEGRWLRSALWLGLAIAIKPLAIVLLLLYGAVFAALRLPLAAVVLAVLALPFLHPEPAYVLDQYLKAAHKITETAQPEPGHWNEAAMMLRHFGILVADQTMFTVRVIAAGVTLALAVIARRTLPQGQSALTILVLAILYLMLFNPRTELGSYLNLGAVLGILLFQAWTAEPRRKIEAYALGFVILGFGTQAYGNLIYRPTDIWLKPFLAALVFAWLAARLIGGLRGRRLTAG